MEVRKKILDPKILIIAVTFLMALIASYFYSKSYFTPKENKGGMTVTAEQELVEGTGTVAAHKAEYAIDGDANTYWESGTGAKWINVDLGKYYNVKKVNVRCVADGKRYYHYDVQASNDAVGWNTIASKTDNIVEPVDGFSYNVNSNTRYLRVYVYYNSANNNVQVSEIKAFSIGKGKDTVKAASKNINDIIQAEACDIASGFTFTQDIGETISKQGDYGAGKATLPSSAQPGAYLKFSKVNFGSNGADQFRIRAKSVIPKVKSNIEIRLDDPDGTLIGSMPIYRQWAKLSYETMACDITNTTGIHDVYIKVVDSVTGGFGINWIQFAKKSPRPAPPKPAPLPVPAEYNVYFGNIHSHSGMSDGDYMPDRAFDFADNSSTLDFMGLTDHSNLMDNQFDWDKSRKWAENKQAAVKETTSAFTAFEGYEMTWYNDVGHMNVFGTDFFDTAGNMEFDDANDYYDHIKQFPAAIVMWNHPWDEFGTQEYLPYNAEADKVIYLIEARCAQDKSLYADYIDVLDKGWHVAPSGNQDNHSANWGKANTFRTAVLAAKLDRENIFDAIRNYRVYSTSDINMKVVFKVNNQIMGSILSNPKDLQFDITVNDPDVSDYINKIEIITEKGTVAYTYNCNSKSVHINPVLPNGNKYYWVKISQADGQFAITAPVWTGK